LTPRTTERKLGILPKPGVVAIVDAPCEWKPGATRRDQGRVERPMNMNPSLSAQLASERQREMLAQASRLRMAARRGPPPWRPGRPSQLSGGPVGCSADRSGALRVTRSNQPDLNVTEFPGNRSRSAQISHQQAPKLWLG